MIEDVKFLGRGVRVGDCYRLSAGGAAVVMMVTRLESMKRITFVLDGVAVALKVDRVVSFAVGDRRVTVRLNRVQGSYAKLIFGAPAAVVIDRVNTIAAGKRTA